MLHAFHNQELTCSSSSTSTSGASHTTSTLPKLDYTETILSEDRPLSKSILPAIMHMITQNFEPAPEFKKNLITLFSNSFYIIDYLEEKIQAGQEIFNEKALTASNIQHCLTTWHFFTKLFEKYKRTKYYQNADTQTRTHKLFDYLKGSVLLSIKYNTDENYWTKDFALFNYWVFQNNDKKHATLNKISNNIWHLLKAYQDINHKFPYKYKYSQYIYNSLLKLSRLLVRWENLPSLAKFQFIDDIYQHYCSIHHNMCKLFRKNIMRQESVGIFTENLLISIAHIDDMLTTEDLEQT